MEHLFVSNVTDAEKPSEVQLMADTLNDAIKVGLIESVRNQNKLASVLDGRLCSKITKAEVTWYTDNLYSADQQKNINKAVLLEVLFDLLLVERTCLFKDGNYVVYGEEVKDGKKTIGVLLVAHHVKVKREANVEPAVQ